jgi:hypothetical protein
MSDPSIRDIPFIRRFFKRIAVGMGVVLALWFLYQLFTGGLFGESAREILQGVRNPVAYTYSVETVHEFRAAGRLRRQDAVRSIVVDHELNKFQASFIGVFGDTVVVSSDGRVTARQSLQDRQLGRAWQRLNNVCAGAAAIPSAAFGIPAGDVLAEGKPKVVAENAKVLGRDAWIIDLDPSPKTIGRVLLLDALDRIAVSQLERDRILSPSERAQLARGDVEIAHARAWVTKDAPRTLAQLEIEMRFTKNDRTWKILLALQPTPSSERPLRSTNLGSPRC